MILKILPICLLAFSSCKSSTFPIVNDNIVLPKKAINNQRIYGCYNWRDSFDFSNLTEDKTFTIDFEPNYIDDVRFLNSLWCYDYYQFVRSIDFIYYEEYQSFDITVNYYTYDDFRSNYVFAIESGYTIDDIIISTPNLNNLPYKDLIFNVRESYFLSSEYVDYFNAVFTTQNNVYVTSYSGYYNFANGLSSIGASVGTFGFITFNNKIYSDLTNNIYFNYDNKYLYFGYYSDLDYEYNFATYNLPFDKLNVVANNFMFNGVKMSATVYTRLSHYGVFSYVRDSTYDDTDFSGLLFTIADVPVYFISQFLSFELFGMNLFIALSGLLTVLVVIFIIRKIV